MLGGIVVGPGDDAGSNNSANVLRHPCRGLLNILFRRTNTERREPAQIGNR